MESPPAWKPWNVWDTPANRWDLSCALVFVCTLAMVLLAPSLGVRQRLIAAGLIVAMGAWYGLIGHNAILRNGPRPQPTAIPYLIGLAVLVTAAQSQLPVALYLPYLLYALNPQFFMALPPRQAFAAFVLLNGIPVGFALARGDLTAAGIVAAAGALAIAHSTILGRWINQIIAESRERHHLIGQLNAARAELAEAHRREGVLEERQRMAGEIHDTLAQGFSSILMLVQAAAADPLEADRRLELAARTARENLAEARALVAAQPPAALHTASLRDATQRLVAQLAEETGIAANFETAGEPRALAVDTEITVLRAAQEALTNVRKHARATSVSVRLDFTAQAVRLEVRDDGIGSEAGQEGYGLTGMRDRVGRVGGLLTIEGTPGAGTVLSLQIED